MQGRKLMHGMYAGLLHPHSTLVALHIPSRCFPCRHLGVCGPHPQGYPLVSPQWLHPVPPPCGLLFLLELMGPFPSLWLYPPVPVNPQVGCVLVHEVFFWVAKSLPPGW